MRGEEAFQWSFNIVNQMIFMWKFFINSVQSDKALFQNMLLKSFESWYDNVIWVWTLSRQSKLFNIFMLRCAGFQQVAFVAIVMQVTWREPY